MNKLSDLIKKQVDLQSHIESRTGSHFRSEGSWLKLPKCPYCGRKNCLKIKRETPDRFTCFACDSQKLLTVIDFEMKLQGCDAKQAIEDLSQMYHIAADSRKESAALARIQHETNGMDHRKLAKQIWEASHPTSAEQVKDILSRRHFGKLAKQATPIVVAGTKINEYDGEQWLIVPQVQPQGGIVGIHKILIADVHTKKDLGVKAGSFLFSAKGKHRKTCLVLEGFFKGVALASLGYSVFITYGAENKKALREWLPKIKEHCDRVLLCFDKGVEDKQEELCTELGLEGIWWEPSRPDRFDVNDLLQESDHAFAGKVEEYVAKASPKCPFPIIGAQEQQNGLIEKGKNTASTKTKPERSQKSITQTLVKSLESLMAKEFPPLKWAVPDIVPEGTSILAGKPKMGKSALALNLALAIACGGGALGKIPVEQGQVLYLALEDGERRLQDRIKQILNGTEFPHGFFFYATEWPNLEKGGLDLIEDWLKAHPQARLVVIDTLAKVRPPQRPGESIYDRDYHSVQGLKRLADTYRVTILIIHHTRKMDATDALETISGSFGLSGGVDGTLVLKRERGKADAVLSITGKEVEEQELALYFKFPCWKLLGNAEEFRLSRERQAILTILRKAKQPMSPKEITDTLKLHGLNRTYDNVKHLLSKMVTNGTVKSLDRGKYEVSSTS